MKDQELTRGQKIRQTNIAKYGSYEAYIQHLREAGGKGGLAKVPKGFALSGKASEAGAKGGSISRRGKKIVED